ncbi:hypothetical protein GCM10027514_08270 [Azotobacter armeniacus]
MLVFAAHAILLIALGSAGFWPLQWIDAGMALYGFLYDFFAHDGLVHQRWRLCYVLRKGYLKRLYLAHWLHHAGRVRRLCLLWLPVRAQGEDLQDAAATPAWWAATAPGRWARQAWSAPGAPLPNPWDWPSTTSSQ